MDFRGLLLVRRPLGPPALRRFRRLIRCRLAPRLLRPFLSAPPPGPHPPSWPAAVVRPFAERLESQSPAAPPVAVPQAAAGVAVGEPLRRLSARPPAPIGRIR